MTQGDRKGFAQAVSAIAAIGFWMTAVLPGAQAQGPAATTWPNRPVRFVVPFPPGGTLDPLARLVGARLTASLGQQFVIDNRPGGSGSIGAALAAKATPDGYTFLWVFDTHGVNPSLIPNLPFDTVKDFAPIMLIATSSMTVVTPPSRP
jgi:tripartite-type tricarboxylate transporter receptor subunit TctC